MTWPYLDAATTAITSFEGAVPWMYLDTRGNVTVGVGQMLATPSVARLLPFTVDGQAAPISQVIGDFVRVHGMPPGRVASFYRTPTSPVLSDAAIRRLLEQSLSDFDATLRRVLPWYAAMPDGPKLAVLDMAFNLGPTAFQRGYPKLMAACAAGDWRTAADQCQRQGPGVVRNRWTAQQLMSGATATPPAATPGVMKQA